MRPAKDHRREAGFAMLFVFLLAGCIAITLYMEMPRVIFEGQRMREQVLIDRGEQYQRAIRVYFRRYRRYPPDLEALENTDNRRFLRRRYRDPMTNEDQWRLIHGLPNGVFTDSLVHKAPGQAGKSDSTTETASTEAGVPQSLWAQRRPSDGTLPSADALPMDTASTPPAATDDAEPAPAPPPAATQAEAEAQAAAAAATTATVLGGIVGTPSGLAPQAGQNLAPFQPQVISSVPVGTVQSTVSMPGIPGQNPSAATSVTGQAQGGANDALRLIQQLLTTPNPQGLRVIQAASVPAAAGPPGIAGVASKAEMEGIMVYNERSKYNEWEFIYDPRTEVTTVIPGGTGTPTGPGGPTQTTPRQGGSQVNPQQGGSQINPRRPGN